MTFNRDILSTKIIRYLAMLIMVAIFFSACSAGRINEGATYLPTATVDKLNYVIPATQFYQDALATADSKVTASASGTQVANTQNASEQLSSASATAEMHLEETVQATPMSGLIENISEIGIITSTQGTYYKIPDFEDHWAFRGYYDFSLTDQIVSDFVLKSAVEWKSSGTNVDYWSAGCGFIFRLNARGDHYLAFLGSDGRVYLYLAMNHTLEKIGSGRFYDGVVLSGNANLLLTSQAGRIKLFVNNAQVVDVLDNSLSTGYLGHAIVSGTNLDFGTSCRMTETDLWKLEEP